MAGTAKQTVQNHTGDSSLSSSSPPIRQFTIYAINRWDHSHTYISRRMFVTAMRRNIFCGAAKYLLALSFSNIFESCRFSFEIAIKCHTVPREDRDSWKEHNFGRSNLPISSRAFARKTITLPSLFRQTTEDSTPMGENEPYCTW